ncbi:RTX-I toxin determinant B [Budvicia aquatica]|nr:RTX-I toxin determinant B [Budvicia aquatica]
MSQSTFPYEPWLAAMIAVARHYRLDYSEENVRVSLEWEQGAALDIVLDRMARQLGLVVRFEPFDPAQLDPWRMPMIVEFTDGQVGVLEKMDSEDHISVLFSGDKGMSTPLNVTEISERTKLVVLLKPESSVPDARVDEYIKPYKKDWFWAIALRDWRRYIDIMLASLVANVLALAGMVFSMQVYDRVVPAQSEATLWVLFGGVMLAIFFEFIMRMTRVHISDIIGKRADLKISDKVFGHALRIRNSARSKSTGSFISQIRELEQVRELITSTTISTLSDLPFFLLFVAILWAIGGPLVFVVLVALPMLLIPGLLIQRPLAKLSNEGMRESAIRNAMLVEAVESLDDIKLLRAEQRFQNQWNHINDVSATISMKQRF